MKESMITGLEPGLIYGLGTLGLAISYRYLRFPDFTVLGSIMVGGVSTAFFIVEMESSLAALALGTLTSGLLGLFTAFLHTRLRIPEVLAGIVSFTAAYSVGFLFCGGSGNLSLPMGFEGVLSAGFAESDVFLLGIFGVTVVIAMTLLMTTKFGALLIAMTATEDFRQFRHRVSGVVFGTTVGLSNALVGFAGGLFAINDRGAYVYSHQEFLPLALAAIFAADAVTRWASAFLGRYKIGKSATAKEPNKNLQSLGALVAQRFLIVRDDSIKIGVLFTSYFLGCLVFTEISRIVATGGLDKWVKISPDWHYAVIALLMAGFVWWSTAWEEA